MNVLVNYPGFGSLWLEDAHIEDGFVIGFAVVDDGGLMNFPVACIRKYEKAGSEGRGA